MSLASFLALYALRFQPRKKPTIAMNAQNNIAMIL